MIAYALLTARNHKKKQVGKYTEIEWIIFFKSILCCFAYVFGLHDDSVQYERTDVEETALSYCKEPQIIIPGISLNAGCQDKGFHPKYYCDIWSSHSGVWGFKSSRIWHCILINISLKLTAKMKELRSLKTSRTAHPTTQCHVWEVLNNLLKFLILTEHKVRVLRQLCWEI